MVGCQSKVNCTRSGIWLYCWRCIYFLRRRYKSTIEEGKLADMVVLSKIYKNPHDEIKDIKVEMTIFNGQIVYRK